MTTDPETLKFLREMADFAAKDDGKEIPLPAGVTMMAADLPGPKEGPRELIDKGWVYREFGWHPEAKWQKRIERIGEGNYKILATTRRPGHKMGTQHMRGQMLINPEGARRLRQALN